MPMGAYGPVLRRGAAHQRHGESSRGSTTLCLRTRGARGYAMRIIAIAILQTLNERVFALDHQRSTCKTQEPGLDDS